MAVIIPKNNYKKPTEIRENVVQAVCEYFLQKNEKWQECNFYYFNKRLNKVLDFYTVQKSNDLVTINEVEMQEAFNVLIKAGYFLFEQHNGRYGYIYVCSEKDFYKDSDFVLWKPTSQFKIRLD